MLLTVILMTVYIDIICYNIFQEVITHENKSCSPVRQKRPPAGGV